MTTQPRTFRRKQKIPELTPGQFCFGLFSIFCLFLILRNSDTAIEYMNRGLRLCAKTVIPSLFPFIEEMAVISFGSQLHARRPGVVRFPTETGRPAVRWPLCVWQGAIISKGLLQAGPSICRAAVPVMVIPIFCR